VRVSQEERERERARRDTREVQNRESESVIATYVYERAATVPTVCLTTARNIVPETKHLNGPSKRSRVPGCWPSRSTRTRKRRRSTRARRYLFNVKHLLVRRDSPTTIVTLNIAERFIIENLTRDDMRERLRPRCGRTGKPFQYGFSHSPAIAVRCRYEGTSRRTKKNHRRTDLFFDGRDAIIRPINSSDTYLHTRAYIIRAQPTWDWAAS